VCTATLVDAMVVSPSFFALFRKTLTRFLRPRDHHTAWGAVDRQRNYLQVSHYPAARQSHRFGNEADISISTSRHRVYRYTTEASRRSRPNHSSARIPLKRQAKGDDMKFANDGRRGKCESANATSFEIVKIGIGTCSRVTALAGLERWKEAAMKLTAIGLATALALSSTMAFAQSGSGTAAGSSTAGAPAASGAGAPAASGTTTGSAGGNLGNNAGSAAAGANSVENPSGNSFINTSPSGSTAMPNGATVGGGRR
jgi:hypothetical protein